jgi:DNA-binding NtrC family response regulator
MSSPDSNPPSAGSPLVYIVDDEPLLLELAEMVLEGNGYRFQKFQDPTEAWSAFAAGNPVPALLITDYAMHAMNGVELIVKCKHLRPELKTILISGTVDESILREIPVKVDHFLRKPYRTTELGDIVRSVLASRE